MTPTDRDRRRAAAELRKCRGGWSSGECYYTIINALGLPDTSREDGGHELYSALADLIEPSGHECVPGECPLNVCHDNDHIDRDALLELAYLLQAMGEKSDEKGRYDLGITFTSIADRIRKALGVEQ